MKKWLWLYIIIGGLMMLNLANARVITCADNPVALWHFDENTGNITYDSCDGKDGNFISGNWTSDGRYNESILFDGDGDYIEIPYNATLQFSSGDWTWVGWVYPENLNPSNNKLLFGKMESVNDKNFQVGMETNNNILFSTYSSTCYYHYQLDVNVSMKEDNWYHLAFVLKDGVAKEIYVNGTLRASTGSNADIPSACDNQPLYIGANKRNPATTSWDGKLDELAIFNRALNSSEVWDIYFDPAEAPPEPEPPTAIASCRWREFGYHNEHLPHLTLRECIDRQ
jgi:hypothetical protein